MSRQRSAVPEPTLGRAARIPTVVADELDALWRVCDEARLSPWWFSSRTGREEEAGRFDLEAPRGTCYWADDLMGALFERLTDLDDLEAMVPTSLIGSLRVWEHAPPPPPEAADTTAKKGGLPKELGTGTDYGPSWAWADKLDEVNRMAVIAWSRIAPHATRTVAVFGPEGAAVAAAGEVWHPAVESLAELVDSGLVADDPTLDQLDVAEE